MFFSLLKKVIHFINLKSVAYTIHIVIRGLVSIFEKKESHKIDNIQDKETRHRYLFIFWSILGYFLCNKICAQQMIFNSIQIQM